VWIGNIKSIKQPELFIRLAQEFSGYPGVKFIMVGRPTVGRYQQRLERMLSRLQNIEYRHELPMPEVNAVLARSHILVNTSRYEGFPNTFIQAWMRSVPVISLNEDPDGMITQYGLGFHSRTFGQLVSDTGRLLSDSLVRNAMAEAARVFARRQCSLESNCARIESMFSALLS
jgi:glycosyltransferase involved in cell wall biosynthesis